ncbi:MAG TPA: polysaccharide biosynthesis/export family protein [Opitutaceae bacterium]|nr:polysaccharide biosynthesis/export family protein [Opitutaceae bacterium]
MHKSLLPPAKAWLLGAVLVFAVNAACPPPAAAADDSTHGDNKSSYKLRPLDLLKVEVFQEPDLEREVRVSKNHTIVLPLIGTIDLTNMTVHDAELQVTELYGRDYLVNPQINITVMEYAPRSLNILGAVNSPGSVVIPPEQDLTLVDAIAHAGGFSRLANRTKVSLTRTLPSGEVQHFTVNADQLISGDTARQWIMHDGDVVFVPESVL